MRLLEIGILELGTLEFNILNTLGYFDILKQNYFSILELGILIFWNWVTLVFWNLVFEDFKYAFGILKLGILVV